MFLVSNYSNGPTATQLLSNSPIDSRLHFEDKMFYGVDSIVRTGPIDSPNSPI